MHLFEKFFIIFVALFLCLLINYRCIVMEEHGIQCDFLCVVLAKIRGPYYERTSFIINIVICFLFLLFRKCSENKKNIDYHHSHYGLAYLNMVQSHRCKSRSKRSFQHTMSRIKQRVSGKLLLFVSFVPVSNQSAAPLATAPHFVAKKIVPIWRQTRNHSFSTQRSAKPLENRCSFKLLP